jgi:K+/H+ antiporter YhaU regulatory subunit KhtT
LGNLTYPFGKSDILIDTDKLSVYNITVIPFITPKECLVLKECPAPSQYYRIALDIASRIVNGDINEGQKISGRSLLASEYSVSPETIRRALKLLADMKVVEIISNSGVFILSSDNAKRYLKNYGLRNQQQESVNHLKDLIEKQNNIGKQIANICSEILESQEILLSAERSVPYYEIRIPEMSKLIGKNLGSLHFWQVTGATIIAIRRAQNLILSPGPFAELYDGDTIIYVGDPSTKNAVERFVNSLD